MNEYANFLANKFIRNGIAASLISVVLIYQFYVNREFGIMEILFPVIAFTWLLTGLQMKQKIKTTAATINKTETFNEGDSFRRTDTLMRLLLAIAVFLLLRHRNYASFIAAPIFIIYSLWLFNQVRKVNSYLNS